MSLQEPRVNPGHILVTGGAGFIGSHLVDALMAAGHRVTVLDDLSTGRRDNVAAHAAHPRFRFVEADVAEPLPDLTFDGQAVTGVVHLAAQVSVVQSMADAARDARTNLIGVIRVLDHARAVGARRVVFASSAAVYGDVPLPAREDAPTLPVSPYGLHKLTGEHHLRIAAMRGIDALSCRFFNVYGPRQVPGSEYAGVISIFLQRAASGRPIIIYGDGGQTRDFVYVGDVVRALAAALFAPERLGGAVVNVGTGRETSILELAHAAIAAVGRREGAGADAVPIRHEPARPGDIVRSVAAVDRIKGLIDWTASVDLASGLATTAAWFAAGA
ncbi:MAG: NAD-dependent epimerase/dehydratase family protein [Myxococcota bacterium]